MDIRVCGFKTDFVEEDIRLYDGKEVVYLDGTKRYPVPDINAIYKNGFHWDRPHEDMELLVSHSFTNNPKMSGGLLNRLTEYKTALILGSARQDWILQNAPEDELVLGLGQSLMVGHNRIDYFISNHPNSECLKWLPPRGSQYPPALFSYGVLPEFIQNYKGLKFFYGSGWEPTSAPLYLIDLCDPLSVALSLICRTECESITLANCFFCYPQERPGTVRVGDSYMYPQQVISLSLASALFFWARRSERHIYILDKAIYPELPANLRSTFKEENHGG